MKTDPPRLGPPRAPASPGLFGPDVIHGRGRSRIRQALEDEARPDAAESRAVVLPAASETAMPRYALAVLGLAIAMFAFSFMTIWKGAEFAGAALSGLTMILLLLSVVADGNKSPL